MLQEMVNLLSIFPNAQWVVAGVDSLDSKLYEPARKAGIKVIFNQNL